MNAKAIFRTLSPFSLFLLILTSEAKAFANAKMPMDGLTINRKNASLAEMIEWIERKTDYTFWYNNAILSKSNKINISVKGSTIEQVLALCVKGQPFGYLLVDKVIVLKPDSMFSFAPFTTATAHYSNKKTYVTNGYQQVDSESSTSSISTVGTTQIENSVPGNLLGNAAITGLQMQKDAKGNTSMVIRGRNTIMGSTDPLVVLDGLPYTGDINRLNSADIESINVLKDGSATSMYGSRGGNGVIVITSKGAGNINRFNALPKEESFLKGKYFYYQNASVYTIFDEMVKRYRVQFTYKSEVPKSLYNGKIPDQISLNQMLDVLKGSGIGLSIKEATVKGGKDQILIE